MAVCCQNLPLGALSSCSAHSVLVGVIFKMFGLFLNTPLIPNAVETLTETVVIFYIFIDMLMGAKKVYSSVARHFKSVSDYIQDILLSIFRSCFMCPYFDKCSLPFFLSEIPISAEKVNLLTERLM